MSAQPSPRRARLRLNLGVAVTIREDTEDTAPEARLRGTLLAAVRPINHTLVMVTTCDDNPTLHAVRRATLELA